MSACCSQSGDCARYSPGMSAVTSIEIQGVTVLRVRGTADLSADHVCADAAAALADARVGGGRTVVVDLGHEHVDEALIALLEVETAQRADAGDRLVLVSSDEQVREAIVAKGTLACVESLDVAAGDFAPAVDPKATPADRQRGVLPPLDAHGF